MLIEQCDYREGGYSVADRKELAARLKRQAALTAARQINGRHVNRNSKLGRYCLLIGELANRLIGRPYPVACEPGMTVAELESALNEPDSATLLYAEQINGRLGNFVRMRIVRQNKIHTSLAKIGKRLLQSVPEAFNKRFVENFESMLSWLEELTKHGKKMHDNDSNDWSAEYGFENNAEVISQFELLREAWAGLITVEVSSWGKDSVTVYFRIPGYPTSD